MSKPGRVFKQCGCRDTSLRHPARDGCQHLLTRSVRAAVQNSDPRRWDGLDQ